MKMENLFRLIALTILVTVLMESCSPTITPVPPVELNHTKVFAPRTSGILKVPTDSNVYNLGLSCGCDFELAVETVDSPKILYDFGNIATKAGVHTIKAFPRPGLTTGTYTGWAAVVTLKPDTNPDLRDTLRDTCIVP